MEEIKCDCGHYEVYGEGHIHSVVTTDSETLIDLCEDCFHTCKTIESFSDLGTFMFSSKEEQNKFTKK